MKIIRRKSDNAVFFIRGEDVHVELKDTYAVLGRERAIDFNSTDHEVVANVPGPRRTFVPGRMVFDGEWAVPDEAEYAAAMPVPASVPRLAARLALLEVEKWNLIQPLIDAVTDVPTRERMQAFYEDAKDWMRQDPTVLGIWDAMGGSEEELNTLFVRAKIIDESLGGA